MQHRPLKVTFLLPWSSPHPVGGFLVIYEHANRLAARGHQIVVLHGWPPRSVAEPFGWGPPEPFEHEVSWFDFDARVDVRFEPVLDAPLLPDADFVVNAFRRSGYPRTKGAPVFFVQGFGVMPPDEMASELHEPCLKVCVSRWVCDRVRKLGGAPSEIAFVPNGVDTSIFRPRSPIATRPGRVAMLFGTLPVKGNDIGLAALGRLRLRVPDVEAVVFGVLPRPAELPEWIEYRQLPSREELVSEVYGRSAVLMCPSRHEGFYLCGLEAMACGCAFVSTDAGGVRDFAEHRTTALLSPTEDAGALAENVARVLLDPALRLELAQAGYERAQLFGWERATERLEEHLLRTRAAGA